MSDNSSEIPTAVKTPLPMEKVRYNWIDQARGFVMFILVVTELMPSAWRKINPVIWFFAEHPPSELHIMDFYDVGVPAFLMIIGLLMSVSFKKNREAKGSGKAVLNALLRWGTIFALGAIIVIVTISTNFGRVKTIAPGVSIFVVAWDVIISIGAVGLLAIPFMFLPNKTRLILAYAMMTFYQIMLFIPTAYWREYAQASIHGGILGGIFVLTAFILVGAAVGEFFIMNKTISDKEKKRTLGIFGIINAAIGVILWLIPGGYPSKPESSMGWAVISIAVAIGFMFLFIAIDYKDEEYASLSKANKGRIVLFKSFGENPFLMYLLVVVPKEIIGFLVEDAVRNTPWFQFIEWLGLFLLVSFIALFLYQKKKIISTTKITVVTILIIVILAAILIPTGIVEL